MAPHSRRRGSVLSLALLAATLLQTPRAFSLQSSSGRRALFHQQNRQLQLRPRQLPPMPMKPPAPLMPAAVRRVPVPPLRAQSAEELALEAKELQLQAEALRLEIEAAELESERGSFEEVLGAAPASTGKAGDKDVDKAKELEAQVLAANEAFYAAYQSKKLSVMKKCWWDADYWHKRGDEAVVVHLGKPSIKGVENVLHSFQGIFRGASVTDVTVQEASVVSASKTVAVVAATVLIVGSGGKSKTRTVATNVFEFDADDKRWVLISHHCSPILFPDVPKDRTVKNE
jgi:ketosteroid isomerase-like protein